MYNASSAFYFTKENCMTTKLTSVDFDKLIIKSIEEIYAFSKSTSELLFAFDQIKSGELSGDNEVVYAEGKNGAQLAALKKSKTTKLTCENGYVVASALAGQFGSDVEAASSDNKFTVQRQENLPVDAETKKVITLTETPVASSVKYIYLLNEDQTKKKTLAVTTDFTIQDKTVTLNEASADAADRYLVIYDTEVDVAKRIINSGDTFSETVKVVVNMLGEDPCTKLDYLIQATMPSADVSGTWSLSVGDNPAVHNFEANAMINACSANKELVTIVVA